MMIEKYLKILEIVLPFSITLLAFYGSKVSQVKYYRRGISLVGIGFLLVSLERVSNFYGLINEKNSLVVINIGYIFIFTGVIILTWFRKKLGL
ncbi:MAG: hypothetical protein BTN85_1541 [Candidatus Methanohalarchaeum thermophilum]|uniref:Uncharacterized protein n=1 Tax=Methanohalarchaeum thermophilum TaxID=1903181 RepID=A0A1Q6DXE2_METT1|nr:MAG: hypothetical protein BTN85_1541 [Candidatus Methanohalarchaeum thermophilum]